MSAITAAPPRERDLARPLPFFHAARAVFGLSLEGMVWSRRSLLMAILIGVPVVLAVVFRVVAASWLPPHLSGFDLYGIAIAFYFVRNVLPLAALFYATSLVADEVEGKTLTYLLTRPVRRGSILAGKFAAYLATTMALALPSVVVTFFLLTTVRGVSGLSKFAPDLLRDLGVVALTILVYGAFFTLLGVLLRRPVLPGLFFLFVWELAANLPGYMPRLTITAYLRSLISHRPAQEGLAELFGQVLPTALCLGVLGTMIVVFLVAAVGIFSAREYVMEQ